MPYVFLWLALGMYYSAPVLAQREAALEPAMDTATSTTAAA